MNVTKLSVLGPFVRKQFCRSLNTESQSLCTIRPMTVTVVGAESPVGQLVAFLLKQCPLIEELRLFGFSKKLCGIALDLSHIDTNINVKAYTGLETLQTAIKGAKIVAICGGEATKADQSEYELFTNSADYVRNIALYTAEFNPHCLLCIATPPIAAMVPLVSEEYKKAGVYDPRRILGITSLGVMRANSIIGDYGNINPSTIMCPLIGAMGNRTALAVVSQTELGAELSSPIADVLRRRVATADDDVLNMKYIENAGHCTVGPAYAISRFITSCIRGLLDTFEGYECAFIRQTGSIGNYLPYMSSLITLGKYGVQTIHMPNLDDAECIHLQRAAPVIRKQITWGESYITGGVSTKKYRCKKKGIQCPLMVPSYITSKVGDVDIDYKRRTRRRKEDAN